MSETKPVVYIFHGEDEFAIAQVIAELEKELGDPATAALNISRLEGSNLSIDELQIVAVVIPFLGDRRLVVVDNWLSSLNTPVLQEKLIKLLENLPPTTRLILVENKTLPENSHWLLLWAKRAPKIAFVKHFKPRTGLALANWIQEQARKEGGVFTLGAAELLAGLAGDDPRMAQQEINKLLAYVNYQRPVEVDDVKEITPDASLLENFALANALRERNPRKALQVLCKELDVSDPYLLVGRIARQFSVLLCARDVLDRGGNVNDIANELKIREGYARHLYEQARKISSKELENIYHRLLEIDEAIKTGKMDGDVALECFVSDYTTS